MSFQGVSPAPATGWEIWEELTLWSVLRIVVDRRHNSRDLRLNSRRRRLLRSRRFLISGVRHKLAKLMKNVASERDCGL